MSVATLLKLGAVLINPSEVLFIRDTSKITGTTNKKVYIYFKHSDEALSLDGNEAEVWRKWIGDQPDGLLNIVDRDVMPDPDVLEALEQFNKDMGAGNIDG